MGAQVGRIRSALRLGQSEAAYGFATRHGRQPALTLRLAAVLVDGKHAQPALHGIEAADGAVAALQLLRDQPAAHGAQAGAAVAFKLRAEHAQRGQLRNQFTGKAMLLEAFADDRQHLVVHKARDAVAHGHIFSG